MSAPTLDDVDLVAFLASLADQPEAPCEAGPKRHGRDSCTGSATHRLQTCLVDELVCNAIVGRVRRHMGEGRTCREHGDPIVRVWRLIPV